MFKTLKTLATTSKDKSLSLAIKQVIKLKLSTKAPQVKLIELKLDTNIKSIYIKVKLPEFDDTLTLEAINYHITTKNNSHFLELGELKKSQAYENSYLDGKRYKIPPEIVKVAQFVL